MVQIADTWNESTLVIDNDSEAEVQITGKPVDTSAYYQTLAPG